MDVSHQIKNSLRFFIAIAFALLFVQNTLAQSTENQQMVFEGSLTDNSGNPISLSGASLTFYISANGCYLYGETSSIAGDSQGNILHRFGSGTVDPGSPNAFSQNLFFGNVTGTTTFASNNCSVTATDTRLAQVYYPAQNITATIKLGTVPYAQSAARFSGKSVSDFVLVSTDTNTLFSGGTAGQYLTKSVSGLAWTTSTLNASQINSALGYTPANSATLGSLAVKNSVDLNTADVTGSLPASKLPAFSGDVSSSAGSSSMTVQSLRGFSLAATAPTSGQVLSYNGSAWLPMTPSANSGSVTNVSSTNSDIIVISATTTPTLTLNVGTGANQIVRLDGSAKFPSLDASNLTNLNASNIVSGTLATQRLPALTGDISTTSGSASATIQALRGIALSATAPSIGQVLSYNGSQWIPTTVSGAGGSVNSIFTGTGLLGGPITSSGTISINFGTASGTVAAGNDSRITGALQAANNLADLSSSSTARANLGLGSLATKNSVALSTDVTGTLQAVNLPNFSGDVSTTSGSAITTIQALRGIALSITTPTSGQILSYNGSQWIPTTVSGASSGVTSVFTGTGLLGGPITSSGTISINFGTTSGTVAAGNDSRITGALQAIYNLADLSSSSTARANLGLGSLATKSFVVLSSSDVSGTLLPAQLPAFSGDISTTTGSASATIQALRGIALSATAPSTGQVLSYNGSQWIPTTVSGASSGVTSVFTGTGLLGGPITSSGTISINFGTTSGTVAAGNDSRIADALQAANNLADLSSSSTARANLGLGSLATKYFIDLNSEVSNVLPIANGGSKWSLGAGGIYTVSNTTIGSSTTFTNVGLYVAAPSVSTSVAASINNTNSDGYGLKINVDNTSSSRYGLKVSTSSGTITNFVVLNSGNVGIGTTAPATKLSVSGGVQIGSEFSVCTASYAGTLRYNSGVVEYCNGVTWTAFGVAGAGLLSLNGATGSIQTFANGFVGTAPAFVTTGDVHTLNIPSAASASVTAGLISNTDYVSFSNKQIATSAAIIATLGYTPASSTALGSYLSKSNNLSDLVSSATARTNLGIGYIGTLTSVDLGSADVTGTLAIARTPLYTGDVTKAAASSTLVLSNSGVTAGTYTKVTVDSKGRVTSSSVLSSADVTTALGYTPAVSGAAGITTFNGSTSTTQTLANGSSGNAPAFTSISGIHTLNIPLASATGSVTAGLISNTDYVSFSNKQTATSAAIIATLGYTPASSTALSSYLSKSNNLSDLPSSSTARINLGLSSLATKSSIDLSTDVTGVLPINNGGSKWGTHANGIYATSNTAIGTSSVLSTTKFYVEGNTTGQVARFNNLSSAGNGVKIDVANTDPSLYALNVSTNGSTAFIVQNDGKIGIGLMTPDARLHLAAGTSSVAPLKFTSGPLLSTSSAGAMEFDGSYLYVTNNSNQRRTIATGSSSNSIDSINTINASGSLTINAPGSVTISSGTISMSTPAGSATLTVSGSIRTTAGVEFNDGSTQTTAVGGYERISTSCTTAITCSISCTGGKKVVGGGCSVAATDRITATMPQPDGITWYCANNGTNNTIYVYAICLKM